MKKLTIVFTAFLLLSLTGCAYRTCPTYTQKVKKTQKEMVKTTPAPQQKLI